MSSKKCPQCGVEAPAIAATCSECGLSFFGVRVQSRTETMTAETRPQVNAGGLSPIAGVGIGAAAVLVLLIAGYFLYPLVFAVQREVQVQTAVSTGDPGKAGISEKNRDAARAALNAIGELESVTSVGTNYQQYTSTLQSAKIKFDAAVRDLKPVDEAERTILAQLEEAMICHVDAKDAWTAFIRDGDQSGFLSTGNYTVKNLAGKYGFSATSDYGYFNSSVLSSIWREASEKFKAAETQIK